MHCIMYIIEKQVPADNLFLLKETNSRNRELVFIFSDKPEFSNVSAFNQLSSHTGMPFMSAPANGPGRIVKPRLPPK